jgi:hypothetical protein
MPGWAKKEAGLSLAAPCPTMCTSSPTGFLPAASTVLDETSFAGAGAGLPLLVAPVKSSSSSALIDGLFLLPLPGGFFSGAGFGPGRSSDFLAGSHGVCQPLLSLRLGFG